MIIYSCHEHADCFIVYISNTAGSTCPICALAREKKDNEEDIASLDKQIADLENKLSTSEYNLEEANAEIEKLKANLQQYEG